MSEQTVLARDHCGLRINVDDFPIVVVQVPREPTRADVDRAYEEIRHLAACNRPIMLIVDLMRMCPSSSEPALRAHLYRTVRDLNRTLGSQIVAEAVVVPPGIFEVLFQTYIWMVQGVARPQQTFPNLSLARTWCLEQVAEHEKFYTNPVAHGPRKERFPDAELP